MESLKLKEVYQGRICEVQKNIFTILWGKEQLKAQLKGKFYKEKLEVPVIGDYVLFQYNPYGDSMINEVLERKSLFKRPDQSGHAAGYVKTMKEQVLAANFDYTFIVASLNQNYNLNRITRYVTATLQGDGRPIVILTKADLCEDSAPYIQEVREISDQVEVYAVSAKTGEGMKALNKYLKPEVTIVLLGSSGVGKSTLVNTMAGEEIMKVSEIRQSDAKGHHTTTHRQLITLPSGVTIIDSPGIRELGMCEVEQGIEDIFADITELICTCRFSDCKHKTEPGCGIRKALEEGSLSGERWRMYKSLMAESKWAAQKMEQSATKGVKASRIHVKK